MHFFCLWFYQFLVSPCINITSSFSAAKDQIFLGFKFPWFIILMSISIIAVSLCELHVNLNDFYFELIECSQHLVIGCFCRFWWKSKRADLKLSQCSFHVIPEFEAFKCCTCQERHFGLNLVDWKKERKIYTKKKGDCLE